MTRFFYDAEFLEDGRTIELISLGIFTEHGDYYYAVNAHMPWHRVLEHDWLRENVVPSLPTLVGGDTVGLDFGHVHMRTRRQIAADVESFIIENGDDHRDGNELWAYYGAYDHVALCQLWGPMINLPRCVPMFTYDLMQLWHLAGKPDKPDQGPEDEHHALHDAVWNWELHKACRVALAQRNVILDRDGMWLGLQ